MIRNSITGGRNPMYYACAHRGPLDDLADVLVRQMRAGSVAAYATARQLYRLCMRFHSGFWER